MSETLFEQYKAALRRGHMAALAGELEQALAAYDDAAQLVPERALPVASRGTVLHRLDRWADAAAAFDRALELAPDDETALRARATAREERGLRSGAAADFERLALVLDVAGRAAIAAEAARRAADLEPSGARAALADRLQTAAARLGAMQVVAADAAPPQDASPASAWAQPGPADAVAQGDANSGMPDDPWSAALDARRLAALADGSGRPSERGGTSTDERGAGGAGAYDALDALRAGMDAEAAEPAEPAPDTSAPAADADADADPDAETGGDEVDAEPAADDAGAGEPAAETEGLEEGQAADGSWPGIDLPSPPPPPIEGPPPEPEELLREAALVLESGEVDAARDLMLTAIRVHREAGRIDAALDIALNVLAIAPGDPRVHLAIANLQLDRGWTGVATEKIELLVRLTSLTGDTQAEADVHGLASERLRDDPAPTSAGG